MGEPAVHDKDFLALAQFLSESPQVLDIGANVGQSIRSFKSMRPLAIIDSFEPNPSLRGTLEAAAREYSKGVTLHFFGLSDADAELTFFTPVVDGKPRLEESSMFLAEFDKPWIKQRLADAGGKLTFDFFTAPVKIGDAFNFSPEVIKIDVEGAELNVAKGLEKTIRVHSPVVLAENSDFSNLTKFMESLSYTTCMSDGNGGVVPFKGQTTNTIYIPGRLSNSINRNRPGQAS